MKKFTLFNFQLKKQLAVYPKGSRGAALIIALVIVATASIMLLGVGRTAVTSTFTSVRYGDTVMAENLAWSGIESALYKVRERILGPSSLTYQYPNPAIFNRNDFKVVRRKMMAEPSTVSDETNGIDPSQAITNLGGYKDYFFDLRISGSDYDIGPNSDLPSVNIKSDGSINRNDKYFKVKGNETAPIWRIFDLKKYTGDSSTNKVNFQYTTSGTSNITVDFYVKYKGNQYEPAGTYSGISNDWDGDTDCDAPVWSDRVLNKNLCWIEPKGGTCTVGVSPAPVITYANFGATGIADCYDNTQGLPAGWFQSFNSYFSLGNYFHTGPHALTQGSGAKPVYIAPPKGGIGVGNNVEYLAIKFTFVNSGDSINYGIYQDSTGTGYIGMGMTNISSTGIYNNVRKTVELWASKNLKLNETIATTDYTATGNALECKNNVVLPLLPTDLNNCSITVYRNP